MKIRSSLAYKTIKGNSFDKIMKCLILSMVIKCHSRILITIFNKLDFCDYKIKFMEQL